MYTVFLYRKWILSSRTTIVLKQKLKTHVLMNSSWNTTLKLPPPSLKSRWETKMSPRSSTSHITYLQSLKEAHGDRQWARSLPQIQIRGNLLSGMSTGPLCSNECMDTDWLKYAMLCLWNKDMPIFIYIVLTASLLVKKPWNKQLQTCKK